MIQGIKETIQIRALDWDTQFFGISCAVVDLHRAITEQEWLEIKQQFSNYKFVTIRNHQSEPTNAQFIGRDTRAFLADVNVQFEKTSLQFYQNDLIEEYAQVDQTEELLELVNYEHSRFIRDPKLRACGGERVYKEWLTSSIDRTDKKILLLKVKSRIKGFSLFSFNNSRCTIELLGVRQGDKQRGNGSQLFKATESYCITKGMTEIIVGTQLTNLPAINFYHKMKCKQKKITEIYHLWTGY